MDSWPTRGHAIQVQRVLVDYCNRPRATGPHVLPDRASEDSQMPAAFGGHPPSATDAIYGIEFLDLLRKSQAPSEDDQWTS